MASTITVGGSINYAQAYCGFRGLGLGASSEPAITAANMVLQTIIGPPFRWNWNRSAIQFITAAGTQDYATSAATFGFIEKADNIVYATITNTSLTSNVATYTANNNFLAGQIVNVVGCTNNAAFNVSNATIVSATSTQFTIAITHANIGSAAEAAASATLVKTVTGDPGKSEIPNIMTVLGSGNEQGEPNAIAPQIDDNAGNITFRLMPTPDGIYQINVIYQKRAPALITTTAATWTPIPDHYSYIYQWGFLALMLAYQNDPRWTVFNQKFVAALLGAAEGLDESQKNIFQAGWLNSITEMQTIGLKAQQGTQARGT